MSRSTRTPIRAQTAPGAVASQRSPLWIPKRVLVTRSAAEVAHTAEILRRCEALGVGEVTMLGADRLPAFDGTDREVYARAKSTMAVVVAPPSALRPQPIPPSADWRLDLAKGCPGHCQYCYLAGSLAGPPVVRVAANLDDVLAPMAELAGTGKVTTGSAERAGEGTTFEVSCYTDPVAIEAVTGSLSYAIAAVGGGRHGDGVGLRFTTKYDDVAGLAALDHGGRTRARFSLNAEEVSRRLERGTAPVQARLGALRTLAMAGYPVGIVIAPIMATEGWRESYADLLGAIAAATADVPGAAGDLTVELITHRFTRQSKVVLEGWYPTTTLEMDPDGGPRRQKRSKFGGSKWVYDTETMAELHAWFDQAIATRLPGARTLYWT